MIINIINLPHRVDRRKSATEQMIAQGASYLFWDGIITKERRLGISMAHKRIIQYAKESKFKKVAVAEDDIVFTHPTSLKYFLQHMPYDFDIYLSGYYSGRIGENHIIEKFCGMTLYVVHERYYDTFLAASDKQHIDTALGLIGGKFVVCPKMCAIQMPGYSDQRRRYADDSNRLLHRELYTGT